MNISKNTTTAELATALTPEEEAAKAAFVPTVRMPVYDAFAIAHPFTDSAQPMPKSYGGPWLR